MPKQVTNGDASTPIFLGVPEFASRAGLPVSLIEDMIKKKELPMRMVGRRRIVPSSSLGQIEKLLVKRATAKAGVIDE